MSISELYKEIILEHNRVPRHFGELKDPTHIADGDNPLCGDHLQLQLRMEDPTLLDIAFKGEACAITIATASLMSELVIGRDSIAIADFQRKFYSLFEESQIGDVDPVLAELNALVELRRHPSRIKCALLPWATLQAALAKQSMATTERCSDA